MNAWEMTSIEFLKSHYRIAGQPIPRFYPSRELAQEANPGKRVTKATLKTVLPIADMIINFDHRPAVIKALKEKMVVPERVLKEYNFRASDYSNWF